MAIVTMAMQGVALSRMWAVGGYVVVPDALVCVFGNYFHQTARLARSLPGCKKRG